MSDSFTITTNSMNDDDVSFALTLDCCDMLTTLPHCNTTPSLSHTDWRVVGLGVGDGEGVVVGRDDGTDEGYDVGIGVG